VLFIAAIVIVFGPWWLSLLRDLMAERQARARAEERAQMAAHVHDSVLQTLALIQRSAEDPTQVVRLARAQERELRSWLFEADSRQHREHATTLSEGIEVLQQQVEADHGVTVEVVVVGDCDLSDALRALLEATREATVNAASGRAQRRSPSMQRSSATPSRSSYAIGDGGSTPARSPTTARASPTRSVTGCTISAGPRSSARRRAAAQRSSCRCRAASWCDDRPGAPRIFLVEDHAVFRAGVRAELGDAVEVVGEADEADAAIELICERSPDVVLLDVHLPGGGGQAVLAGCSHPSRGQVPRALGVRRPEDVIAVIRAGARGYLTKTVSGRPAPGRLPVAAGDAVFSPRLAGFVLDAFAGGRVPATSPPVSTRARPDLASRARSAPPDRQGYTYKEVARDLMISTKTVESHVSSVLRKLQLSTRHELTKWATDRRLV